MIEQALQRLVELQFFHDTGICVFGFVVETAKYRNACAYTFEGEQVSFVAIVQVSRVIGNLVRQIDQLSFQRRTLLEHILRKFRKLAGIIVVRMLDDAFAHLECQIQSPKSGITHFEIFDNPQGMQIVVEERSVGAHSSVESFFPGVPEGRMPDIMHQG